MKLKYIENTIKEDLIIELIIYLKILINNENYFFFINNNKLKIIYIYKEYENNKKEIIEKNINNLNLKFNNFNEEISDLILNKKIIYILYEYLFNN